MKFTEWRKNRVSAEVHDCCRLSRRCQTCNYRGLLKKQPPFCQKSKSSSNLHFHPESNTFQYFLPKRTRNAAKWDFRSGVKAKNIQNTAASVWDIHWLMSHALIQQKPSHSAHKRWKPFVPGMLIDFFTLKTITSSGVLTEHPLIAFEGIYDFLCSKSHRFTVCCAMMMSSVFHLGRSYRVAE